MKWYVSKNNVIEAIKYFKESEFPSDDALSIFLLAKHTGITTSHKILVSGEVPEKEKDGFDELAKLTNPTEEYQFGSHMFPTNFKDQKFFNQSSERPFSRLRDTIKQKNSKVELYNWNGEENTISLKQNFKDIIQARYLNNQKISMRNLAAWIFRFTGFDFEEEPTVTAFTRVIRKALIKYFHIKKSDTIWLFKDDFYLTPLKPENKYIAGRDLRSSIGLSETYIENIKSQGKAKIIDTPKNKIISRNIVEKYQELTGDNASFSTILETLRVKKQIILTGVPGTGKSRFTRQLAQNDFFEKKDKAPNDKRENCVTVQFHADYSYDDFIGGTILKNVEDKNNMVAEQRKGVLLDLVENAKVDKEHNYLLVIDEINRGNIASILGETILALDRNYKVKLKQPIKGVDSIQLPDNLYIVGTMNTSDRNIAFLDLALRRRFAFIRLEPNYDVLSENYKLEVDNDENGTDIYDLGAVLREINNRIVQTMNDPDKELGQSYFIPVNGNKWDPIQFQDQFNFVLLPTLQEYDFQNNGITEKILGDSLSDSILDEEEFYTALKQEFSEMVKCQN
ncbi:hypothetical protein F5ESL0236_00090 [Lactobacillus sp. ESL0236]|uniref:McrB family protein n=1 Tax=unclassified Lactobacillus TaxID=2620435 RepID=UPI000EFB61AB|nr:MULTISPECIES: AAA family ATPase [unclassified Lactobacillus]RMC42346.1 hypothetical protein F5ESL0237_00090 [Lactobacillus sp. ESL0237]RMC45681.1 hypothetical protein F5ESL0234_00090 [Lactobacillus sp. ESL0234]RMC47142.1 hypothetical protein F5ESL0236_00090 [Lactobacillus sp. ESL0236]